MRRAGFTASPFTAASFTAALLTAALLAAACSANSSTEAPKSRDLEAPDPMPLPFADSTMPVGPLATAAWRVGVDALDDHADAAFLGYLDAAGTVSDDGSWELVLGSERMADRAAFGALQLGLTFSRRHEDVHRLAGATLPDVSVRYLGLTPDSNVAATRARLEAVAEVGGHEEGTLLRTTDVLAAARVVRLAERLGLSPRTTADSGALVVDLPELGDRATVAGWTYVCPRRVPGAGAPSCWTPTPPSWTEPFDALDPDRWVVATTGPLADRDRNQPPAEAGGVSWTNREAQVYRPEQVTVQDGSLWLEATPNSSPSLDTTPFVSGMVVSSDSLGWGRVEVDVVVPRGSGLWPAVWLLPIAACEAPGRCPGYRTRRYVEVDVLETIGHEPGRLHTSLHWSDDQLRSTTEVHEIAVDDGGLHTVWMEWRPGVITHGVGNEALVSFSTALEPRSPLASAPGHRLVINLAVGGTFAGEGIIGRNGSWWGDTSPPPGWPALDWDRAVLAVDEVRFHPLS